MANGISVGFSESQKEFELAPEGPAQAVLVDIIDHGEEDTKYGKKERISFVYQLATRNSQGERFEIRTDKMSKTLGADKPRAGYSKAKLRVHIEDLLGRALKIVPGEQVPLSPLIGKNARVVIRHRPWSDGSGKVWAYIHALEPWREGPEIQAESYVRKEKKKNPDDDLEFPPKDDGDGLPY